MAAASWERAPAFTAQELVKLVDEVLPQYTLLYGPPDQQRRGTHCRKRWEDIRRWSKKTAEAQLGMASQRGRGARRTMTPLMFRILAVAYPELDGRLRASQQTQGVVRVKGLWSAPATRASSVTRSQSTASSPPVKHLKLESARRERVKTPASKTDHKGPGGSAESAVTPPKVVKGQKRSPRSGKSSTAEKAAILPTGRDATASSIITGPETTARVSALEGSSIVTGPKTTGRVSALEGSSIVTGPETTASVSAQRAPAATARWALRDRHATHRCIGQRQLSQAPLNRAKTAMVKTAEQGKDRHGTAPLNRSETAKASTAEQGKERHGNAPLNRSETAKASTAEQGRDRHGEDR
ncbi:hypothetical protein NDU88_009064 [Pleurodeles waltl]|uniref:Uncharacterized protein n=1 Tax=Pleurodeles waltl TaxID=8319 RepID=A0AAV7PUY9_PLEWA|nr:hypothetical protein NDU88_009064 [Pleurodeles waltl]